MVLRRTREDREWDKFTTCDDGNTAVRTAFCSVQSIQPSGLTTEGKITEVSLSASSWTALPATPLTDRNAISIQNLSGIEIKVNYLDSVGYVGMVVASGSERFYDITDEIVIYGRAASGTPTVVVEEIA